MRGKYKISQEKPSPLLLKQHVKCLNCGDELTKAYCETCGQSAHTHRISLKHFLEHDLIHGLFHVDKGIFSKMRDVAFRPGHAAIHYIQGKRAGKFPVVTLLVILCALLLVVRNSSTQSSEMTVDLIQDGLERSVLRSVPKKLAHIAPPIHAMRSFVNAHSKWFLLAFVPLNGICTWVCFRGLKLNYAEHMLINTYIFAGALVFAIAINIFKFIVHRPFELSSGYVGIAIGVVFVIGYWQVFRQAFSILRFSWRLLAAEGMITVIIGAISLLFSLIATP